MERGLGSLSWSLASHCVSDPALLRQMQESSFYDLNILDDGRLCPCASSDDRHLTRTRCRVHRLAILVLQNLDSAEFLYV